LSDYLDESTAESTRAEIAEHINGCPNCWVVLDTTRRTIQVYKGEEPQPIPARVHERIIQALEERAKATRG
jgi:predicted anti-sigma-YlaC factor YlaD